VEVTDAMEEQAAQKQTAQEQTAQEQTAQEQAATLAEQSIDGQSIAGQSIAGQSIDGQSIDGQSSSQVSQPQRDDAAVATFVERFADLLVEAGMPRMPSRIFVRLLATDSGRLSAAELSEHLQISPAGVSGAIRYLAQVEMVTRERPPGSRREYYRVSDDTWYEALTQRDRMMLRWVDSLRDGVQALGAGSPAGQRVRESQEFMQFTITELPAMLERWRNRKKR
jgi:DNA-binding transcriptional regulator GbsR (MarR family)